MLLWLAQLPFCPTQRAIRAPLHLYLSHCHHWVSVSWSHLNFELNLNFFPVPLIHLAFFWLADWHQQFRFQSSGPPWYPDMIAWFLPPFWSDQGLKTHQVALEKASFSSDVLGGTGLLSQWSFYGPFPPLDPNSVHLALFLQWCLLSPLYQRELDSSGQFFTIGHPKPLHHRCHLGYSPDTLSLS